MECWVYWNKELELVEVIKIKGINVTVISETKKKLKGTKMIGNYTMLYRGVSQNTRAHLGVVLRIDQKWTSRITNYSFVNDCIITVRLKINRGHITRIGVYAWKKVEKKKRGVSTKSYKKIVDKYNKSDSLTIYGDLNARVGNQPIPNVVGTLVKTA